jgi:hypothetical protein
MVRGPDPKPDPLSSFLNSSAAYALHDSTALFHAAYAHEICLTAFEDSHLRRSRRPSRGRRLPCRSIRSDSDRPPPSCSPRTFEAPPKPLHPQANCAIPGRPFPSVASPELSGSAPPAETDALPQERIQNEPELLPPKPGEPDRRLRSVTPLTSSTLPRRSVKAAPPVTFHSPLKLDPVGLRHGKPRSIRDRPSKTRDPRPKPRPANHPARKPVRTTRAPLSTTGKPARPRATGARHPPIRRPTRREHRDRRAEKLAPLAVRRATEAAPPRPLSAAPFLSCPLNTKASEPARAPWTSEFQRTNKAARRERRTTPLRFPDLVRTLSNAAGDQSGRLPFLGKTPRLRDRFTSLDQPLAYRSLPSLCVGR